MNILEYKSSLMRDKNTILQHLNNTVIQYWRNRLAVVVENLEGWDIYDKKDVFIYIEKVVLKILQDYIEDAGLDSLIEDNPNLNIIELEKIIISFWKKNFNQINADILEEVITNKKGIVNITNFENGYNSNNTTFLVNRNTRSIKNIYGLEYNDILSRRSIKSLNPIFKKATPKIVKTLINMLNANDLDDLTTMFYTNELFCRGLSGLFQIWNPSDEEYITMKRKPSWGIFDSISGILIGKNLVKSAGLVTFLDDYNYMEIVNTIKEVYQEKLKNEKYTKHLIDYVNYQDLRNESDKNSILIKKEVLYYHIAKDITNRLDKKILSWDKVMKPANKKLEKKQERKI